MAHLIPRQQVLRLYKEILSAGRRWEAAVAADTGREREYIRAEARRLFRKNQNLTDGDDILQCLQEGKSRLELAKHYRIPYPRLVNVAPEIVELSKNKKAQLRRTQQAKPVYLHSQDS